MNITLYITKRYLIAKSSNNTINIITKIATFGVIISSMALFVVLSAFSGLKSFNHAFLNVSDPDVKIFPLKGKSFQMNTELIEALVDKDILNYTKTIEEHALLDNNGKRTAITIKGVDANFLNVTALDSSIYIGEWLNADFKNGVVVGSIISNTIATMPNSFEKNLKVLTVKPGKGQLKINSLNKINVETIGLFRLNLEMDGEFVFASLKLIQELLNYDENQLSNIELKINPKIDAENFAKKLQQKIGSDYKVLTRYQLNATFYKMLNTENLFAYLIATLIGIIAFFNVIGAIIMMILDKRENVKTLYNLGLRIKEIKKVFFLQGILLSVFGLIVGLLLAFIIIFVQSKYKLVMINYNLAYPVEFHFSNLIIVVLTILGLGFIASYIASTRVSKKLIL